MPEKKKTAAAAPAVEAPAAEAKESKTRKSAKAPARRGRPPLAPELYVEFSGKQYNVTDIIDRAKADYRATHKEVKCSSRYRCLPVAFQQGLSLEYMLVVIVWSRVIITDRLYG